MKNKSFFRWKPEYNTNLEIIDQQHKEIVNFIDELYMAVVENNNVAKSKEIVDGLYKYALNHFSMEEDLIAEYDYPEAKAHKLEHEKFRLQANEFFNKTINNQIITFQLIKFLKEWLLEHISTNDKYLANYIILKKNGNK